MGRTFVTGDVIYRKNVFPALDPKVSPDVMQEWIFPTFTDQRVLTPLAELAVPLTPSLSARPEAPSVSAVVENPAVSPSFTPFCPRELIPLTASIHAPRRLTVTQPTLSTSISNPQTLILDSCLRS